MHIVLKQFDDTVAVARRPRKQHAVSEGETRSPVFHRAPRAGETGSPVFHRAPRAGETGSPVFHRAPRAGETGLTLIEMIVVLVIIAIVSGLIVANVAGRPDEAKVTVASTNLSSISGALKLYRLDNGDYPTTSQGLKALVERPTTPPVPLAWTEGGYLSDTPIDPWGNAYIYSYEGGRFELKSLGKDGKPGGEGLDADIVAKRN